MNDLNDTLRIWTNTATLDDHLPGVVMDADPASAELALIGSKPFPIDEMPGLRGVFRCGVGTDNIPAEACADRGIAVCMPSDRTVGFIYEETANFAVHLVLQMLYADTGTLNPWWKRPRPFLGDRRVLVVGAGRIGSRVASKLERLVDVHTHDAATDSIDHLHTLLPLADVVTLHVPMQDETRGMVDAAWLARMSDGAALVNTARGPVVDEAALKHEIQTGRLRGAFDVFWQEPYTGPLAAHHPDGFLMSPHVASTSEAFLAGLAEDFLTFRADVAAQAARA
jgi:phosphoglycerate dehydrogenase-like enzyme